MVTVVVLATGEVAMVTFSTLLPGGMVTLGGTLATCGLLLVIAIVGPPDVETALNQIEANELLPPMTGSISTDTWPRRSEEHTSELQSQSNLVCRLLLEKKKKKL